MEDSRKVKSGGKSGIFAILVVLVCVFSSAARGQYCGASGGCDEYIMGVQVGTINNTGTVCSGYADYTSLSTEMDIGIGYAITVANGDPYSGDQCGVWVDWNQDSDFDDAEESIYMTGGPATFTGTITPPGTAVLGSTRMRVRIMYTGSLSPCGDTAYGEVEDYTVNVVQKYGGGVGEINDPYLIYTAAEMQEIGANPSDWGAHFRLMADIDLSGYTGTEFNIIGDFSRRFSGVFDGNGHAISNFRYSSDEGDHKGLFGYADGTGMEIKDLGLIDPCVSCANSVHVGSVIGGLDDGRVTGCWVEGAVISGRFASGGLIGMSHYGEISNCKAMGAVSSEVWAGGLVGYNSYGTVLECESASIVDAAQEAGVLVGSNDGFIAECFSTGSATVTDRSAGGLAGNNYGEISRCYSVSDAMGGGEVGGLVGRNLNIISDCYAMGDCSGTYDVGGLVGLYWDTYSYDANIINSYSAGSVSAGSSAGGLIGYNIDGAGVVTNCFWDVNTSGIDSSAGGTGLPTAQMQTESTFTNAGWDFVGEVINGPNDIWDICEGTNYPKLVWSIPAGDFVCPDGVDMFDFGVLGDAWMSGPGDGHWDPNCDISEPNDNVIDGLDLGVFVGNWLEGM